MTTTNTSKKGFKKLAAAILAAASVSAFCAAGVSANDGLGNIPNGPIYQVQLDGGSLAMRSSGTNAYNNQIGALYNDDIVVLLEQTNANYWYVYSQKLGYGYVSPLYINNLGGETDAITTDDIVPYAGGSAYTVSVPSGYLALRDAPEYTYESEIGKFYSGETVLLMEKSTDTYWMVEDPRTGRVGYVNKNYLI